MYTITVNGNVTRMQIQVCVHTLFAHTHNKELTLPAQPRSRISGAKRACEAKRDTHIRSPSHEYKLWMVWKTGFTTCVDNIHHYKEMYYKQTDNKDDNNTSSSNNSNKNKQSPPRPQQQQLTPLLCVAGRMRTMERSNTMSSWRRRDKERSQGCKRRSPEAFPRRLFVWDAPIVLAPSASPYHFLNCTVRRIHSKVILFPFHPLTMSWAFMLLLYEKYTVGNLPLTGGKRCQPRPECLHEAGRRRRASEGGGKHQDQSWRQHVPGTGGGVFAQVPFQTSQFMIYLKTGVRSIYEYIYERNQL